MALFIDGTDMGMVGFDRRREDRLNTDRKNSGKNKIIKIEAVN